MILVVENLAWQLTKWCYILPRSIWKVVLLKKTLLLSKLSIQNWPIIEHNSHCEYKQWVLVHCISPDTNLKGSALAVYCGLIWNNCNFTVGLMRFNYGIPGGILNIILQKLGSCSHKCIPYVTLPWSTFYDYLCQGLKFEV